MVVSLCWHLVFVISLVLLKNLIWSQQRDGLAEVVLCCCPPLLLLDVSQTTYSHFMKFQEVAIFMISSFDSHQSMTSEVVIFMVFFHEWCSGANRIAFYDFRKKMQNDRFPGICHLAGTRAPLLKSSFHSYFHKLCSGVNQMTFYDSGVKLQNHRCSLICDLAGTGASLMKSPFYQYHSITLAQHDVMVILYH